MRINLQQAKTEIETCSIIRSEIQVVDHLELAFEADACEWWICTCIARLSTGRNKQRACLKQSTDIIQRLDELNQVIIKTEQWVPQELVRSAANQRNDEHYFAQRNIPAAGFKNQVKNAFYKEQNNKNEA